MRIHFFSIHGLFRGSDLEIGRDADNGGQIIYVMELAKELSKRPEVEHIDLFTRKIDDKGLSPDYAREVEQVNEKFTIRRIQCGGKRYLPKEKLWPHLDEFVTNTIKHVRKHRIFPDLVHSHYADAGYVGAEVSGYLHVPMVHSAHSLGQPKFEKVIESGLSEKEAYDKYQFHHRFEAEELTLSNAEFVVTSTAQEIGLFDEYKNRHLSEYHVIPPGINFDRFYPYYDDMMEGGVQRPDEQKQARLKAKERMDRFLSEPNKPIILAICRPDRKKNIQGLIHAYGTDKHLQSLANLAIFAGIRKDISTMADGEKETLTEILLLMDKYNLYGKLAIPKSHDTGFEVPEIYRLTARQKGVFVNIALTEQFGLTMLEATACGCPVVATNNGGPAEIVPKCKNGYVVSPEDTAAIQKHLKDILVDEEHWSELSNGGIRNIQDHFSWQAHATTYLKLVTENLERSSGAGMKLQSRAPKVQRQLKECDSFVISDIDGTLLDEDGDKSGVDDLRAVLEARQGKFAFGVASGRSLELIKEVMEENRLPMPDVIIGSVGSTIHYGYSDQFVDKGWLKLISNQWDRESVIGLVSRMTELVLQPEENQKPHKVSYFIEGDDFDEARLFTLLGAKARHVNIIVSRDRYVDILPKRASKGRAVRYLTQKWSTPLKNCVLCGDSGNDLDMLQTAFKGVVVKNYAKELEPLKEKRGVYFSKKTATQGVLDGLKHFRII